MDHQSNYYENVLSDFAELKNSYLEKCNNVKTLENFASLLREELRIARDAERTAEFKKNSSQMFVAKQQEAINKLLSVKEEKEILKQNLKQSENEKNDLVNKFKTEQAKREQEIKQMKNNHIKEILLIKETADADVLKAKEDSEITLNRLNMNCIELAAQLNNAKKEKEDTINSLFQKFEEKISVLNNNILALQAENTELKERSATNIAIFQKKLSEQEAQHQSEMSTWRRADINSTVLRNQNYKPCSSNNMFETSSFNQQSVNNLPSIYRNQQPPYSRLPLNVTNKTAPYQTAKQLYKQIHEQNAEDNAFKETAQDEIVVLEPSNTNIKAKPKFPAAVKKRKLFNQEDYDWSK